MDSGDAAIGTLQLKGKVDSWVWLCTRFPAAQQTGDGTLENCTSSGKLKFTGSKTERHTARNFRLYYFQ
jgi:hypothetical protein